MVMASTGAASGSRGSRGGGSLSPSARQTAKEASAATSGASCSRHIVSCDFDLTLSLIDVLINDLRLIMESAKC
jgi:hypothetical protein